VIALLQSLLGQPLPTVNSIDFFGGLHRDIKIPTFNGKLKSSIGILNKV